MKVTLAYAYGGHGPDETVDLPDDVARRLLSDGTARRPVKAARKRATSPRRTTRPRHDSGASRTKEQ